MSKLLAFSLPPAHVAAEIRERVADLAGKLGPGQWVEVRIRHPHEEPGDCGELVCSCPPVVEIDYSGSPADQERQEFIAECVAERLAHRREQRERGEAGGGGPADEGLPF